MGNTYELSNRGFKQMPEIITDRKEEIRVYESSAAMAPHLWIRITIPVNSTYDYDETKEAHAHLSLDEAEALRDQLDFLIKNHYHDD